MKKYPKRSGQELYERVYDYAMDVIEGIQVAGKKHIYACQRFVNKLNKLSDEDCPIYLDRKELESFDEWASLFKHTKGAISGQYIQLTDFQLFMAVNILCFKRKKDGLREIKSVYVQLARKNAKSQFLAIISSYIAFLSEEAEEVYISGWTREQSEMVYKEIIFQLRSAPALRDKYSNSKSSKQITHIKSQSIIKALSREAKNFGEGSSPSLVIIDERHTHPSDEIVGALESGMGARPNGLSVSITTAGKHLNYPCKAEYDYCSKIVDPNNPIENDVYFVLICELDEGDDPYDENNWIKANPIQATHEAGIESIRHAAKLAKDQPNTEKEVTFLTKNCNIWVQAAASSYMHMDKWAKCGSDEEIDLMNRKVWLGLDIATKRDLCSLSWVIPLENNKFYVDSHSFMPEEGLEKRISEDKAPFKQWVRQGLATPTDGSVVDFDYIIDHINNLVKKYNWKVQQIGYDQKEATMLSQKIGSKYEMVEIGQSIAAQNEPLQYFRDQVTIGNIIHPKNGLLTWAVGNAVSVSNADEQIKLSKLKSTDRIDPLAAIIDAMSLGMYHEFTNNLNKHVLGDDFSF